MSGETFTVWVSKYALSSGIYSTEVRDIGDGYVRPTTDTVWSLLVLDRDCHRLRADAAARGESMRKKKIKSLQRQIDKLETLDFYKASP